MEYLNRILNQVTKPARYTGGEWNAIVKEWKETPIRIALCYPEIYEIGMSTLALPILYNILNRQPDVLAERVYAPWVDMEAIMRKQNISLFSLESRHPLKEFDIIGFSLGYELTYTNVLNILDLAQIPLLSSDREDSHPLIIAGGSCAFNPEPLADFIDLFVVGEGEEIILELLEAFRTYRGDKKTLLKQLARLDGRSQSHDELVVLTGLDLAQVPLQARFACFKHLDLQRSPVSAADADCLRLGCGFLLDVAEVGVARVGLKGHEHLAFAGKDDLAILGVIGGGGHLLGEGPGEVSRIEGGGDVLRGARFNGADRPSADLRPSPSLELDFQVAGSVVADGPGGLDGLARPQRFHVDGRGVAGPLWRRAAQLRLWILGRAFALGLLEILGRYDPRLDSVRFEHLHAVVRRLRRGVVACFAGLRIGQCRVAQRYADGAADDRDHRDGQAPTLWVEVESALIGPRHGCLLGPGHHRSGIGFSGSSPRACRNRPPAIRGLLTTTFILPFSPESWEACTRMLHAGDNSGASAQTGARQRAAVCVGAGARGMSAGKASVPT